MSKWPSLRRPPARRPYARSNLRRLEWGQAGRHRRRTRRAGAAAAALIAAGAGVAVWFAFFKGGGPATNPAESPPAACASAKLPGRLGALAWVESGRLDVLDLDRCTHRTLVRRGVAPPVRFSPDGKWIAFGSGSVVSSRGGHTIEPLRQVASWEWGSSGDQLVGVTDGGKLVLGSVRGSPTTLVERHVGSASMAPDGRNVAVSIEDRVEVFPLSGGAAETLYTASGKSRPEIVGWSPDSRWVLFWVRTEGKAGVPLNAAPVPGAGYHNVFDPVLPYADFVTWCGTKVAVSGGGAKFPSEGQQLLTSMPPDWGTHNLSRDFRSSWIWPACSPDHTRIAVTLTPSHVEDPPGQGRRSVWVISLDGKMRRRLAGAPAKAYEAPRWSADGRFVMVIERSLKPDSPGTVHLIRVDPKTGKPVKTVGGVADLGSAEGQGGHTRWTAISDWYRPNP